MSFFRVEVIFAAICQRPKAGPGDRTINNDRELHTSIEMIRHRAVLVP